MIKKISALIIINVVIAVAYIYFVPDIGTNIAMDQFQYGTSQTRTYERTKQWIGFGWFFINAVFVFFVFCIPITLKAKNYYEEINNVDNGFDGSDVDRM